MPRPMAYTTHMTKSKSARSNNNCFACQRPLNTTQSQWLVQTSSTSNLKLCGDCADEIASRDGDPRLVKVTSA